MNRGFTIVALLAPTTTAIADPASGEIEGKLALQEGREYAKQKRWDEACARFEASLKADETIPALYYLADCNSNRRKLATAWTQFGEVIRRADLLLKREPNKHENVRKLRAYAAADIEKLEARLPKLNVTLPPGPAPVGLKITRNGIDITSLVGTDIPVDLEKHVIVASADGMKTQTIDIEVTEEKKWSPVAIGVFEPLPAEPIVAPPPPDKPAEPTKPLVLDHPVIDHPTIMTTTAPTGGRRWGYVAVGGGGAVVVGGLIVGLVARSQYNQAEKDGRCDANLVCDTIPGGFDRAKMTANISTALVGVGLVGVAGGAVLLLLHRSSDHSPRTSLAPVVDGRQVGVVLSGHL